MVSLEILPLGNFAVDSWPINISIHNDTASDCYPVRVRVKRLCLSICVCVIKNTAVYCLTTRKLPQNGSQPLSFAIHIL